MKKVSKTENETWSVLLILLLRWVQNDCHSMEWLSVTTSSVGSGISEQENLYSILARKRLDSEFKDESHGL